MQGTQVKRAMHDRSNRFDTDLMLSAMSRCSSFFLRWHRCAAKAQAS